MKDIGKKLMDIARWYSMPADHFNTIKDAVELLEKTELKPSYNSVKTELNGDAISRRVVLDMLKNINADTDGVGFYYEHYFDYIKNLPPVTSQPKKSSTENPHRSEIKQKCDRINDLASILPYAPHREIQELLCEIMELSSVSTEKTGRWIDVEGYEGLLCKCSNCCKDGERYKHRTHQSKTNYCPDCGAKMEVEE